MLGTKDAAIKLGTTPKRLRKFLRDSPDYGGTGMGGRYGFDEVAYNQLSIRFSQWKGSNPAPRVQKERASTELSYLDSDKASRVVDVHRAPRSPRIRQELMAKAYTRKAKLLARMKEVGL